MPPESSEDLFVQYLPFLAEIKRRITFLFFVFLFWALLGFVYYEPVITLSLSLFRLEGVNIAFTSPFQFITLAISAGLAVAVVGTLPLVIYQFLSFLKPALEPKEYRFMLVLMIMAFLFFGTGFFYGVTVMKYVLGLFYENALRLNIQNLLDVSSLLSQIILTSSLMGLAFQFPIALTALLSLKTIGYRTVVAQRPFVYLACLVFAALLPPTDLLSLLLLTVPLIVLFESTLLVNRFVLRTARA